MCVPRSGPSLTLRSSPKEPRHRSDGGRRGPNIPIFRDNTAAFVHDLPATALANVDGDSTYVRVQVLTNAGALDREKQIAMVRKLTELIAAAAD